MLVVRPDSNGIYPIKFTLWRSGNYSVHITNNNIDVQGSPFTISVLPADIDASASIASGPGLLGGIAGTPTNFQLQVKDTKKKEVQYVMTTSSVPGYVSEVQQIKFSNVGTGTITFRGRTTSPIIVGTSNRKQLYDYLNQLNTVGSFTMTDAVGAVVDTNSLTTISNSDVFKLTFSSLVGPLPLLTATGPIEISSVVKGEAPFRASVSVVRCSGPPGTVYLAIGSKISPSPLSTSSFK